jgi:BESS motif
MKIKHQASTEDSVGVAISQYLEMKQKRAGEKVNDEDTAFMLSYVPVLKRLPGRKRAAAKMKIAALMKEMEFSDDRSECRSIAANMNRAAFSNVRGGMPSAYDNHSSSEC